MNCTTEGCPVHGDGVNPPHDREPAPWAAVAGAVAREPGLLPVTVVGTDPFQLRRLVRLLSATPGVEVVSWGDPEQAASGGVVVSLVPGAAPVRRPQLSPRQREVLTAYGAGSDLLDVVARRLGMYPETLKTHLRRIRQKYREVGRPAPTRRDLYVRAVEDGLLPPPG